MLRKIRIAAAALFFGGITLLFVGIGHQWWGWMAKLQFLPSCMALNFAAIAFVLLLTFVFGRIYCSVICPMGVFQDLVIRVHKLLSPKGRKPKRHFVKEPRIVRYGVLALVIVTALTFSQLLLTVLAPYSAYGRMVRSIVGLSRGESLAPALLITAAATLVVICVCAWIWGRGWCNTVCPVGTVLGLVSRFSLFNVSIDQSQCVSCRKCEKGCKSSCIDIDTHTIDHSRCVDCFDCLDSCPKGGIKFRFSLPRKAKTEPVTESVDKGRRAFMATTALIGGSLALGAQNKRLDGGLADVIDKTSPERAERLVPFGAESVKDFYDRCTACQLCVSNCPNGVLRPSTDIGHFLQPQMGYEKGWCRPECTTCSQVCPAGAIRPLKAEEKLTHKIGTAKVNLSLCLAAKDEASCGNCSRHCPVGAVRMVKTDGYHRSIPVVAEAQCIGCGACEYLCPARPISAITVDGISVHIKKD